MNKSDILMFLQNCTCKKYCPLPHHNICKLVERERVTLEKRDTLRKETHFVFFLVTDVPGFFVLLTNKFSITFTNEILFFPEYGKFHEKSCSYE